LFSHFFAAAMLAAMGGFAVSTFQKFADFSAFFAFVFKYWHNF
jgi:hypothetical protein